MTVRCAGRCLLLAGFVSATAAVLLQHGDTAVRPRHRDTAVLGHQAVSPQHGDRSTATIPEADRSPGTPGPRDPRSVPAAPSLVTLPQTATAAAGAAADRWVISAMTTPGILDLQITGNVVACSSSTFCRVYVTTSASTGASPVTASFEVDEIDHGGAWNVTRGRGA